MRLFRARRPFVRRHILLVLRRRLINVARTRMLCCLNAERSLAEDARSYYRIITILPVQYFAYFCFGIFCIICRLPLEQLRRLFL